MKTKITVKQLRKLNAWIKSDKQARKIIVDINTKPSYTLRVKGLIITSKKELVENA